MWRVEGDISLAREYNGGQKWRYMSRDKAKILWIGDQHSDEKSRDIDRDR